MQIPRGSTLSTIGDDVFGATVRRDGYAFPSAGPKLFCARAGTASDPAKNTTAASVNNLMFFLTFPPQSQREQFPVLVNMCWALLSGGRLFMRRLRSAATS